MSVLLLPACAGGATYQLYRAYGVSSTGSLRAAGIAAASAYAFTKIGDYYKGVSDANKLAAAKGTSKFGGLTLTSNQIAGQIASHAVTGGVISELSGGKFGNGFVTAGLTKGFGGAFLPGGRGLEANEIARGTIISAVIGGTTSVISGGKFANGAITASYQYLFNQVRLSLRTKPRVVRNFRDHSTTTDRVLTIEEMGPIEAGTKSFSPDLNLHGSSSLMRSVAKGNIATQTIDLLIGKVEVTTFGTFQHKDDKWIYDFDLIVNEEIIGSEQKIIFNLNTTSGHLINTYRKTRSKFFWQSDY